MVYRGGNVNFEYFTQVLNVLLRTITGRSANFFGVLVLHVVVDFLSVVKCICKLLAKLEKQCVYEHYTSLSSCWFNCVWWLPDYVLNTIVTFFILSL